MMVPVVLPAIACRYGRGSVVRFASRIGSGVAECGSRMFGVSSRASA